MYDKFPIYNTKKMLISRTTYNCLFLLDFIISNLISLDEKDEKIMDVNAMGIIKGTKVAVRHLTKRGGGVIIATSSALGLESYRYVSHKTILCCDMSSPLFII